MSEILQVASEFYRPIPQPHEPWTPLYTDHLAYKMAQGERVPLWFNAQAAGPVSLTLSGTGSANFTAEFFKPYGQKVDNSDANRRATLTTSPQGTYFDPLNPIPTGAGNFLPEIPSAPEYVYLLLSAAATTPAGTYTLTVTLGAASVTLTIRVWAVAIPAAPSRPLLVGLTSGTANKGIQGKYISDPLVVSATNAATDLLVKHRLTPYGNGLVFLPNTAGKLDIDAFSTDGGGSFRLMLLNRVAAGDAKFWMCSPETQAAHRTLAYAQAAEAAIAANSLTNMWLYVWDEPTTDTATATAIKTILDAWKAGSPSTKMLLTASLGYFSSAGAIAAGLVYSDYGSQLVLVPVVNQIGGSIGTYTNNAFGYYSSCQGNCGFITNSNATSGSDQGMVDFAYIDYPMVRRYAAYLLSLRTTWRDKTALMLHYDSSQAWNQFAGSFSDDSQNPWLSARRFNVMGDGTFIYPAIPSFKPHVGIPAFPTTSVASVPSIRLLYLAHASFMADLFQAYLTAQADHQADNLATNTTTFVSVYQTYESLRDKIGTALEAHTVIAGGANPIETVVTIPPPATQPPTPPTLPVTPPADPTNPVQPPVTPPVVVPPPQVPPPVIPQPPVDNNPPVSGGSSGPAAPDLPTAVPSVIEGPSGLVAILPVDTNDCYAVLSNTLYKFSKFAAQYSLGVDQQTYLQRKISKRWSDKVLECTGQLTQLPPPNSALMDFFQNGSVAANYGNGVLTRTLTNASISGKMLDLRGTGGTVRSAFYGSSQTGALGLCPLLQTGTIRLGIIPAYTGTPGLPAFTNNCLYCSGLNPTGVFAPNYIALVHQANGTLVLTVTSSGGTAISCQNAWAPVSGGLYIIDATFDFNQGLVEIWINGVFFARTAGATTLSRSNTTALVQMGDDNTGFTTANHQVFGLALFNLYRAWNKWEMMGVPVGERFNLTAYNISYSPLSDEQHSYQGAGSTDGGANL